MCSLKTWIQRFPIGSLFDFVQKGLLVGVTARAGNDVGHLFVSQGTFEPLIRVHMAGQDRGGDAPSGLNDTVKRDLNVRVASVCRIERVWRMVNRDNECFVFGRIGYLTLQPLLLLTSASSIKRAVHIRIKAD